MNDETEYGAAEYLCYEVLRQMESRGAEVPETSFNKLCALVYEEVDEEEVELPCQWYQYGYEVNREYLLDDFLIEKRRSDWSNTGTQITIEDVSSSIFDVSHDVKEIIQSVAKRYTDKFHNTYSSSHIKDYSYEHQAPNEFVKVLNEFRSYLDDLDPEGAADRDEHVPGVSISYNSAISFDNDAPDIDVSEVDDEKVHQYLRELGRTFPEEYTTIEPVFYEWKTLCKELLRYNLYGELRQFQKAFWNTASRVELRIQHNENIPAGEIHRWIQEREEHLDTFEEEMETKRGVIQNHRQSTSRLESIGEAYDETVDNIITRIK